MQINNILIRPLVTEKASQNAQNKVYMFEVAARATKNSVAEALKSLYSVEVSEVKITNRKGKVKRTGRRMIPRTLPNRKIAYVKVIKGSIDLFPQT